MVSPVDKIGRYVGDIAWACYAGALIRIGKILNIFEARSAGPLGAFVIGIDDWSM